MNFFVMLAILGANIIAIILVYQFVKKIGKKESILFIAICVAAVYISVSIAYWISGFGIDKNINEIAKSSLVYLFVPVNVIILIPFIASKYVKYKEKKVSKRDFASRLIKVIFVAIIILIVECIYFKHVKMNIGKYSVLVQQKVQNSNENKTKNNEIVNEESSNEENSKINKATNVTTYQEFLNTTTNSVNTIVNDIQ